MIGFKEQEKLLALIGSECRRMVEAFVLGGSAMLFYNFSKTATKDIDLLLSEKNRDYLVKVLKKIGFILEHSPKRKGEPCRLTFKDYILDLFAGSVFKMKFSPGMQGRLKEKIIFSNLTVSVISPEDIILSKSMTDRAGDREDAASIVKEANLDWGALVEECKWQSRRGDSRFPVFLHDFLEELVHDFKASIPENARKQIQRLYRDFLEGLEQK